jgi:capsular polysaccharide export protein
MTDVSDHQPLRVALHAPASRGWLLARRLLKLSQWVRMLARRAMARQGAILATSMDICDDPAVTEIFGTQPQFHSRLIAPRADRYIGWGRKWSGRRAVEIAQRHDAAFTLLEDGFLRSVERHEQPLSLVADNLGVHYDATAPSRLESMIKSPLCAEEIDRASRIVQLWRANRVSKYNASADYAGDLPKKYVLVVDQVRGDLSIKYGAASAERFETMLQAACWAHPNTDIIVKLHPDVYTNAAKSHFDPLHLRTRDRVSVIADDCHPVALIAGAQAVFTVTSQVGFEALIWGKPVHTFGMPFYAGWGLTQDHLPTPKRRGQATLEQLVHAALVGYTHYFVPKTHAPSTVEDTIAHIGRQREKRMQIPRH